MLNAVIRFALQQRLFVVAVAILMTGYGTWKALQLPLMSFRI